MIGLARPQVLDIAELAWPLDRAAEATEALARRSGLLAGARLASQAPAALDAPGAGQLEQRIENAATHLGLEAEPVSSSYGDLADMLRKGGPALIRLPATESPQVLALLGGGRRHLRLLGPDLRVRRVPMHLLHDRLCAELEAPWRPSIEQLLQDIEIAEQPAERMRRRLLAEQLGARQIEVGWMLRLLPSAGLWQQARRNQLLAPLATAVAAMLLRQFLLLLSWWFVGQIIFAGRIDAVWLWAWALLQATALFFDLLLERSGGLAVIGIGTLFKQRLFYGLLKLQPEETRHEGMGQFIERVMSTDMLQLLALNGGILAILSFLQLATAMLILAYGAGGWPHALLLLALSGLLLLLAVAYERRHRRWNQRQLEQAKLLVEHMVGHRTRLAQEDPARRHQDEDRLLDAYLLEMTRRDQVHAWIQALPALWMLLGTAALVPGIVIGNATPLAFTISLGGVLLAAQALYQIVSGLSSVLQTGAVWEQVAPLFRAAARTEPAPAVAVELAAAGSNGAEHPLLVARELSFRYRDRGHYVLQDASLTINSRDRLLLEGPSGGGKSTLAALLAGLRRPETGLLLLHGYDQQSLGSADWRRRVVVAPQFHENHVFSDTFAFNLLMGRQWPPKPDDLAEAQNICEELGLGELLQRMPAGMFQILGESGWQLSHGERSRLFIARALLQPADLLIMDESFGALDPETMALALRCVLRRAPALVVIAHP